FSDVTTRPTPVSVPVHAVSRLSSTASLTTRPVGTSMDDAIGSITGGVVANVGSAASSLCSGALATGLDSEPLPMRDVIQVVNAAIRTTKTITAVPITIAATRE